MLIIERGVVASNTHVGHVAARYRSGVWSDQWTDVSRCAEHTFTDYAPACVCGWRGLARAAIPDGYLACRGAGFSEHHINPTTAARSGPPRAQAPDQLDSGGRIQT